jgi:metal-dependent HD superfamily phosphatase/phosphodiesterase
MPFTCTNARAHKITAVATRQVSLRPSKKRRVQVGVYVDNLGLWFELTTVKFVLAQVRAASLQLTIVLLLASSMKLGAALYTSVSNSHL